MKKFMNIKNRSEFICGKLLSFFSVPIVMVAIFSTEILSAKKVTKIAAGSNHTLLLKQDSSNPGTLWAMGDNQYGQLGDGTNTQSPLPVQVKYNGVAVSAAIDIAVGDNHALVLMSDKTLLAMGRNNYGQLGVGSTDNKNSLVQVDTDVAIIAADGNHSLFVKDDGSMWAMGRNNRGQLGDGSTDDRISPVEIRSSGVDQIAAGDNHSIFIDEDNSLWVMGYNQYGQLGNGNDGIDSYLDTPYQLETSGVTKIAAGGSHSLYIKNNKLWGMGANGDGQLGDSTVWDRNRPILLPIEGKVTDVYAGANHSFYTKEGSLWTMGSNEFGQLGIGASYFNQDLNVSIQIPNSSGATVATSTSHSLLLKPDGSLYASGKNENGQLGLGAGNFDNQKDFQNAKVKAYFLNIDPTPDSEIGTVEIAENTFHFAYGASANVTASPSNSGYVFSSWSGDFTETSSSLKFEVTEDKQFSAIFKQDEGDNDNDGLTNYIESLDINLDPNNSDTDGDGFTDFEEYNNTDVLTLGQSDTVIMSFVETRLTKNQNDLADAEKKGENNVINNPSGYPDVYSESDLEGEYSKGEEKGLADGYKSGFADGNKSGFVDGNKSGVAYVQANPEKFNFLTDAEKNASYDLGYTAGHTAGLAEAEAAGLGEAQAKLALENLSSLTYLDEIRALKKSKPHTDGWYFQPGLGWLWTNRDTFPFLYRQAEDGVTEGWLYFSQLPEQIKKPYYDYNAEKWISSSGN